MSGVSELNKQGLDRIEKVLNGKENYYRGFVNFMNDSSVQTRYYYLCHVCAFMECVNKEPSTLTFDDFNKELEKVSLLERKYIQEEKNKGYKLLNRSDGGEWGNAILGRLIKDNFLINMVHMKILKNISNQDGDYISY